jgi:hypothetical protein
MPFNCVETTLLVIENALRQYIVNVIPVFGNLCLGLVNEMKKLGGEYEALKKLFTSQT